MALSAILLFIPACFALNMAPGPNNLLAFTNAARLGIGRALLATSGRLVAFAIMVGLTAVGLGALLHLSETAFNIVKWLGAAYLVYVGLRLILSRVSDADLQGTGRDDMRQLARREFLVAAGNPKAIAIFTAFFPQFVDLGAPAAPQLAVMGVLFLLLEAVAGLAYALAGSFARRLVERPAALTWLNRTVGAVLVGSGVSLALSER